MNTKSLYSVYLFPAFIQIILLAVLAGLLKMTGVELGYHSVLGIVLIVLAGVSSAFWGVIYQKKCHGKRFLKILREFLDVKQTIKTYLLVTAFLILDFGAVILGHGFEIGNFWLPIVFFLKSLLFGGIEEIGWRYSFQTDLEKKVPYFFATLITFACWGAWHFLFFYIDGSLANVDVPFFLLGLLTNSFILSALFNYSGSLWICAMTHAFINALSQVSVDDKGVTGIMLKVICICLALIVVHRTRRKN
ncbi:CPBP family intramembrane glutamic endopeptidase [Streptococcus dentiloxodontae]